MEWNKDFDFGEGEWNHLKLTVRVKDKDTGDDLYEEKLKNVSINTSCRHSLPCVFGMSQKVQTIL